jgi:NADH-quinone oxidoreductase subunit C
MPDAPGLELIRAEVNERHPDAVLDTSFAQQRAALIIDPARVLDVLRWLRDTPGQEYRFLSSLHAADYLPAEPRFAVHYELLNRDRVERLRVKALLPDPAAQSGVSPPAADAGARPQGNADVSAAEREQSTRAENDLLPELESCVALYPTAEFQEREAYDFFGILFRGHPDLRRIFMPDDYVGWPQRRDFPIGGEPVLFTHNEVTSPGWWE